jgi:hypothetical protein
MSDSTEGPEQAAEPRRRSVILGLILIIAVLPGPLPAAPIRARRLLVEDRAGRAAEDYFTRALRDQRRDVEVPPALRRLQATDDLLPDTAFVRYLRWRREIRPAQFDRRHPRVAAMMIRDAQARATPVISPTMPSILTRCDCPTPSVIPSSDEGTKSPEPASLLMAIVLAGSVALSRRRDLRRGLFRRP